MDTLPSSWVEWFFVKRKIKAVERLFEDLAPESNSKFGK